MITKCRYNKDRDIQKTIPNLAMSIENAIITGVINATGTEIPYTNETEVSEVGSYLTDNIEIAMAAKRLGESMSSLPTNASNPSGENA